MINIASKILEFTAHRPFPLPGKQWFIYQQWKDVVFLHTPVRPELVRPLIPPGLQLDTTSGYAWISVVLFEVADMRMRFMPVMPLVPEFNELNLRTYVQYDKIPGIYFTQIKANKKTAVTMTNLITKLRYQLADLKKLSQFHYSLTMEPGRNLVDIDFTPGPFFREVPALDRWLTERYCCYQDDGHKLYRYHIHHPMWPLYQVNAHQFTLRYSFPNWKLTEESVHLMHYSPVQSALIWRREQIA